MADIDQFNRDMDALIEKGIKDFEAFGTKLPDLGKIFSGATLPVLTYPFDTRFLIAEAQEQERLVCEIAALAKVSWKEVNEFYQEHPYSLEFIKAAVMAAAMLDVEDLKKTMEEQIKYATFVDRFAAGIVTHSLKDEYTFTVILPNSDRREVKAACMEVDDGCLYFEDDDNYTILAFAPGHWVWAERLEEETE